jgi:hypothetical protein
MDPQCMSLSVSLSLSTCMSTCRCRCMFTGSRKSRSWNEWGTVFKDTHGTARDGMGWDGMCRESSHTHHSHIECREGIEGRMTHYIALHWKGWEIGRTREDRVESSRVGSGRVVIEGTWTRSESHTVVRTQSM